MSKLTCKCPKCKATLRFEKADKNELKITCPKCQHPFQIKVKSAAPALNDLEPEWNPQASEFNKPTTLQPVHRFPVSPNLDLSDADSLQDLLPTNDHFGPVAYHEMYRLPKKSSFRFQTLMLPVGVAVASIGGVSLIGLAILWGKQFLPQQSTLSNLSDAISGSLLGSDTRSGIEAEHIRLRAEVEAIGSALASDDQSEDSAMHLRAELPKFKALFLRACRLPTESRSMQEYATARGAMLASLETLRSQSPNGLPASLETPFWSVKTNAAPDELVTHARNEITLASASVGSTLAVHVDYPDPMTYTGSEFAWSEDDRQVLAFIYLHGSMQRDTLRALAAIDPKNPSSKDLANAHATIDRYVELAKVVRKRPRKTSSLIAFVPKDNPYESLQRAASVSITRLREVMEGDTKLSPEVDFLFKEVDTFSEVCEGHLFGFQGRLPAMLTTDLTSSNRFKEFIAAEEKKKEEARIAESDRLEKESRKLAEEKLQRQKSEEQQREQEEERKRALAERVANPTSGLTGNRSGPRNPDGPRGNVGPRPGAFGTPTGPDGNIGQSPFQTDFSGSADGARGIPPDRFQPPLANRGDPAKMVTISAVKVRNSNSTDYTRDLPKWILQYSPLVIISNGDLKITLQNFDKPLTEIEACFPMLIFEKIDSDRRTILAKEK